MAKILFRHTEHRGICLGVFIWGRVECGGRRIATVSVRTGLAMTPFFARSAVVGGRRGEGTPPYGGKREAEETGRRGRRPLRRGLQEGVVCRADVGIGPYGCVAGSAVRWATARVAPTEKGSLEWGAFGGYGLPQSVCALASQ